MPLVSSGTISIGGYTTGRSVNLELGRTSTYHSSLGESAFRTLAGRASGAIGLYNFYGKSNGASVGVFYGAFSNDAVIRINSSGTQIGSETTVGSNKSWLAGAGIGTTAVFYGVSKVTRINSSGTQIGSETTVGTTRYGSAGAGIGTTGIFYAGAYQLSSGNYTVYMYNTVTRINTSGTSIGSQTAVSSNRYAGAGAGLDSVGIFYGGSPNLGATATNLNIVTRINTSGAHVGGDTSVGTARQNFAGASIDGIGIFYAGSLNWSVSTNKVTRINTSGTLIGGETSIGVVRKSAGCAGVQNIAIFYHGSELIDSNSETYNTIVRINSSGVQIGSETTVGSASSGSTGAGI